MRTHTPLGFITVSRRSLKRTPRLLAAAVLGALAVSPALAVDRQKADNIITLNQGASWVNTIAPGAADVAVFDNLLINNFTYSLGANLGWLGIRLTSPAAGITLNSGNTLNLGAGGIDMSAATQSLTLNNVVTIGTSQSWNVATATSLIVGGNIALGANTLSLSGAGNYDFSGNISGTGNNRIILSTGSLTLSGTNSFARLSINGGVVNLNSAGALPTSILNADGGTLNLNGRNINVTQLTGAAGLITDHNLTAGITSLTVTAGANTTFAGSILEGSTRDISLTKRGNSNLVLTGSNNYSAGTTVAQGNLVAGKNNAFGTGDVTVVTTGSNATRVQLNAGVTITNNITTFATIAGTGNNGILMFSGNSTVGNATFAGTISLAGGNVTQGGDIGGASGVGQFLVFSGPIIAAQAHNLVIVRFGNVMFSGGGSYENLDLRTGLAALGANNGIATNAVIDMSGNGNQIWDLSGFNQSILGLKNTVNAGNSRTITNSSATPSILTFTPGATGDYTFGNGGAGSLMTGELSIVLNGSPTGVQALNTVSSTYTGTTTVTSGILAVNSLGFGGGPSSIGGNSTDPTRLILDGGVLRVVTSGDFTDRSFTITAGKTGFIDIAGATNLITMTGTSAATTGNLTKLGLGSLVMQGVFNHTGITTVGTGALIADGTITAAVSVSAGAVLGGSGLISGVVTVTSGGILAPGSSVGTLTAAGLALNAGSNVNVEFGFAGNDAVNVLNAGGLVVNGGNLNLFAEFSTNAFSTNGTYSLFDYNTNFTGNLSNLGITNAQAGKTYSFIDNTSNTSIQLVIGDAPSSQWINTGSSTWTNGGNWSAGIPNAAGITARFGTATLSPATVTLSGNKTVGGIIFDNVNSYRLQGDSLIIDNGASAAINTDNGVHTIASNIQLNSSLTVNTGTTGGALVISGNISGARALAVTGSGSLNLTGTNTYTSTTITGGTLIIGDGGTSGTLGTGDVLIGAGGTLTFNRADLITVNSNISGASGTVIQNGSGTLLLGGANSFGTTAGGLIVFAGVVKANNAGALPQNLILTAFGGTLDLNGFNAALTMSPSGGGALITDTSATAGVTQIVIGGNDSAFYSGSINDGPARSIALTKTGGGSLSLSAASTYSGGTTINRGVVAADATNALGTGTVTLGVTGSNLTRLDVGNALLPNNFVINAIQSGVGFGAINGTGSGTLTGNITINAAAPGNTGHIAGPGTGLLDIRGVINSPSVPVLIRNGNVRLSGTGNYEQLQIQAGTTSLGADNAIDPDAFVALGINGNANLDLNGFNQTLAAVAQVANNVNVTNTAANQSTLTLATSVDLTLGGSLFIGGSLTLVKTGAAGVTVSAANTYTGPTFINQGALIIANNASLGAQATGADVNLNGGVLQTGGTFALENGTNGSARNVNVLAAGGTVNFTGNNNTLTISGVVSGAGPLFITGTGALLITGSTNYTGNASVAAAASLRFGGVVTHNINTVSGAGTLQIDAGATLLSGNISGVNAWLVNGNHNLRPGSGGSKVNAAPVVGADTQGIFTGTLNIADNGLIIQSTDSTDKANKINVLNAAITSGSGTGSTWTGTGITSSSTQGANSTNYAVGVFDNSLLNRTSFFGQTVDDDSILVAVARIGDSNRDGIVDINDLGNLANKWQQAADTWDEGDFNRDGFVDINDLGMLASNWQQTSIFSVALESFGDTFSGGVSATNVPEPASLAVLAIGGATLLARRRRR